MTETITEHSLPTGQVLRLIHGDLTEERVDAIVNAANAQLAHGAGVAGAIVRRGGAQIQRESDAWVRAHGPASHDRPALTGAGRLPSRHVIHAVGPVWGVGDEDRKLHLAVQSALDLAAANQLRRVALPAISTGVFGFPKERAATVIVDAILDAFAHHPPDVLQEVRITLIDRLTVDTFAAEFARRWPETTSSL